MNRREAVQRITLLLGGALSTQLTSGLMGQMINFGPSVAVSAEQEALIAELADVIIPTTDTPGAKAAHVEQFIVRVLRDCYLLEKQEQFYAALDRLETASKSAYGKKFAELEASAKNDLVKQTTTKDRAFFALLKQLTVAGYFISEIGATQALEYLPIPGRFEGEIPLQPGQKAWAI